MHPSLFECETISNIQMSKRNWLITLRSADLASAIEPGQFVHLRVPAMEGHILRRPFSVYDANPNDGTFDILYQTVGFGTDRMTAIPSGDPISVIGPIGRGWRIPDGTSRALLVGGGVGAAPLLLLSRGLHSNGIDTTCVIGASDEDALSSVKRLIDGEDDVHIATDDGSVGFKGFCTVLAEEIVDSAQEDGSPYDYIAVCGPEPVMRYMSDVALRTDAICEVSMEKRMACGIGACLSCVVDTHDGKKRACVDGPVFFAKEVIW